MEMESYERGKLIQCHVSPNPASLSGSNTLARSRKNRYKRVLRSLCHPLVPRIGNLLNMSTSLRRAEIVQKLQHFPRTYTDWTYSGHKSRIVSFMEAYCLKTFELRLGNCVVATAICRPYP
jgi:hypothetical protein